MFRRTTALLLAPAAVLLAACAQTPAPQAMAENPHWLVPTTAIVTNQPQPPFTASSIALAANVLPMTDAYLFFPRGERETYGITPLSEYRTYSIYTYDQQPIGVGNWGYGYRYRSLWDSGTFAPPPLP
jgi:hypothetical protein